jgi:hypothetical protein
LSSLSVASTRIIDSTFTPIGRAECAPNNFFGQPRYMKSKIYEAEDFRKSRLKSN